MAAPKVAARPLTVAGPHPRVRPTLAPGLLTASAQLLPSLLFLAFFFVLPVVALFSYSFLTRSAQGSPVSVALRPEAVTVEPISGMKGRARWAEASNHIVRD